MDELQTLIGQADGLPKGPAKVAVLEEAIRLADARGDLRAGFDLREQLIDALYYTAEQEKYFPTLAWMLAQIDRDPEEFDIGDVIWNYKWVISQAFDHPEISLENVKALLADFALRAKALGVGARQVRLFEHTLVTETRSAAEAGEALKAWRDTRRDWLSDCAACEADSFVDHFAAAGEPGEALEAAQPILQGQLRCAHVPHLTFGRLLIPLLRLEQPERAEEYHQKGYELAQGDEALLDAVARHLEYVALSHDPARGKKILDRHWPEVEQTRVPKTFWRFGRAALLWQARMEKEGLPSATKFPTLEPPALKAKLQDLAARFDRRNGNLNYRAELEATPALLALARPLVRKNAK